MEVAIYLIAPKIGMPAKELIKAIDNGDIMGGFPVDDPLSKMAWVDLLSLRNYVEWLYEHKRVTEQKYLKAIRHIEMTKDKLSMQQEG
ncbi:hypothetical protein [Brevibacillus daliensis]|uniref:hypothetical protein n=1 Tax=Brevibacillus daliensis TaxID=2892995 RepID=UPI001E2ABCCB|nr:hypothetical protein [Brevibacillus daliensis]